MGVGEYKLAIQRASRAAYAHVKLEVHETPGCALSVDAGAIDGQWRAAVTFGVEYAVDRLTRQGRAAAARVVVTSLHWMPVDPNQMAVAFVAYQASCIAFGLDPDDKVRLRPDWVYEFPA